MAAKQGPQRSKITVPRGLRRGPKPIDEEPPEPILGAMSAIPKLPEWLAPHKNQNCTEARDRWHQVCKILIERQCFGGEHIQAVEQLCYCYQKLKKIQGIISLDGEVIRDKQGKASKVHPLLKERSTLLILIRSYLHDFGMIPPKGQAFSAGPIANGPRTRSNNASPFEEEDT